MREIRLQLGHALAFADGAPDVSGLPCDKIAAEEAGEYMRRYHLENTRDRAIRFHHILASDPGTDLHDHPWDFVSVMLDGAYTEITPDGAVRYEAPCVIMRKAEQLHRLVLEPGASAWTYVVTGRARRHWGFSTEHGWVPWARHEGPASLIPCEPPTLDTSRSW